MKATELCKRFRNLLASGMRLGPASVFDPMSARIAESLGCEMGMPVPEAPDLVLLTLSEFAYQGRRIRRAAALPLVVNCVM